MNVQTVKRRRQFSLQVSHENMFRYREPTEPVVETPLELSEFVKPDLSVEGQALMMVGGGI